MFLGSDSLTLPPFWSQGVFPASFSSTHFPQCLSSFHPRLLSHHPSLFLWGSTPLFTVPLPSPLSFSLSLSCLPQLTRPVPGCPRPVFAHRAVLRSPRSTWLPLACPGCLQPSWEARCCLLSPSTHREGPVGCCCPFPALRSPPPLTWVLETRLGGRKYSKAQQGDKTPKLLVFSSALTLESQGFFPGKKGVIPIPQPHPTPMHTHTAQTGFWADCGGGGN